MDALTFQFRILNLILIYFLSIIVSISTFVWKELSLFSLRPEYFINALWFTSKTIHILLSSVGFFKWLLQLYRHSVPIVTKRVQGGWLPQALTMRTERRQLGLPETQIQASLSQANLCEYPTIQPQLLSVIGGGKAFSFFMTCKFSILCSKQHNTY